MRRFRGRGVLLASLLAGIGALVLVDSADAQLLQGSITGNVFDLSSAAVVGAKVVATDQQTNFTRETTTNEQGGYNLLTMPPGIYRLTVTAPSFQTTTITGVSVSPEQITRRDVSLTVGQVTENVTVSADATVLQTDKAEVRDELNIKSLANVPVPMGRNYQMLFITLPGISPPTNSNSFTANSNRGLNFSVGGGYQGTNSIRVDGAGTFNMTALTVAQFIPGLEAIESVSVAGNSLDAEQTTGGGAVNITIKSGTNSVHGTFFEDHTNQHLQAYPWKADRTQANPKYINNQYGVTIGGPIKKDKLFYFGSFEGTGLVQVAPFLAQVPTTAIRTGNLSASKTMIYDPGTGNPDGTGRLPFTGNIILPNQIDSGVRALLARPEWPAPNQVGTGSAGLSNNLLTNGSTYLRRAQTDAKVNWNPTSKIATFVRLGWGNNYWTTPGQFGVLGGPGMSNTNTAQGFGGTNVFNGTISGTYIISPTLIFDAHYGYDVNIAYSTQPAQDQNLGWTLMQIPGLNTAGQPQTRALAQGGLPTLTIDGFAVLGSQSRFQPQDYWDPERNYDANLSWIKRNHNLRFGFDSDIQRSKELQWQAPSGNYISGAGGFHFAQGTTQLKTATGTSSGSDYNAFASFLLGYAQESGKVYQWPDYYYTSNKYFGLFVRDQWQVTPKLTLNIGVRADYFFVPVRNGTGTEYFDETRGKMFICGVASVPTDCGIYDQYKLRWAPRFGAAYRITERTVIRAGFGITSDPINIFAFNNRRENFPFLYGQILTPPNSLSYATTLRQGMPVLTAPDLSAGVVDVPGTAGLFDADRSNYKRGYIQTYNFTIEQRIKEGWTASVGYVGSKQVDPWMHLEQNWSALGTGTAGQRFNNAANNFRTALTPILGVMGGNNYNSLQGRIKATLPGFTWTVGYTWSKNLGYDNATGAAQTAHGWSAIPAYYRAKNYGPAPIDIRHNFQSTAVYELPVGKGKAFATSGLASTILGGWQLSGLMSIFGGRPFTAISSAASLNAANSSQFADCNTAPQQTGDIYNWYDRSAFSAPSGSPHFGSCGMFSLRGPGLINVDGGLEKKFAWRERWNFAFRIEAFNLGNHPHHASPGYNSSTGTTPANNVTSSSFMQAFEIANTGRDGVDQRTLRLALKMSF
jgi:hypothetical protein